MVSKGFPWMDFKNEGDGVKIKQHCSTFELSSLMRGSFITYHILKKMGLSYHLV